jgi:VWFA-related protein
MRQSVESGRLAGRCVRGALSGGLAATLAVVALSAPRVAAAQEPSPFGETIEVRVVNLEVVVTDRDGNRVQGLAPQDFRLRVDGQVVPIEYFTEVRGGTAVEGPAAGTPGMPALAAGSPVATSYLVFVDELFTLERDRDRALDRLRGELPGMGPEDRMAIVAFDGKRVEMLSTWSGSVPALERALTEAGRRKTYGMQQIAERRNFEAGLRRNFAGGRSRFGASPGTETRLEVDERMYAQEVADDVSRVVSAAVATLRGFASPPGRKVMLLVSGGWPFSPAEFVVDDLSRPILERDVPGGAELFRPISDTANLLGYTLYTIDAPGLQAEIADASTGVSAFDTPGRAGLVRENLIHDTLQFLARETGGRALVNAAAGQPLSRAMEDTRSYYWLGFTPTRRRDDQRHDVEVEVLRPGLQVRTRDSFLDVSRPAEVSMAVESSLLFGNTPSTRPLVLEIGKPQREGRGRMKVPITVALPADAVTLLPVDGAMVADLELRVAAMDDTGAASGIPRLPIRIRSEGKPGPGATLRHSTTLELRTRPHRVVVAVYDVTADVLLSASADIKPP